MRALDDDHRRRVAAQLLRKQRGLHVLRVLPGQAGVGLSWVLVGFDFVRLSGGIGAVTLVVQLKVNDSLRRVANDDDEEGKEEERDPKKESEHIHTHGRTKKHL